MYLSAMGVAFGLLSSYCVRSAVAYVPLRSHGTPTPPAAPMPAPCSPWSNPLLGTVLRCPMIFSVDMVLSWM